MHAQYDSNAMNNNAELHATVLALTTFVHTFRTEGKHRLHVFICSLAMTPLMLHIHELSMLSMGKISRHGITEQQALRTAYSTDVHGAGVLIRNAKGSMLSMHANSSHG